MLVVARGDSRKLISVKFISWFHPLILASLMDTIILKKYAESVYNFNFFVDPSYQLTPI